VEKRREGNIPRWKNDGRELFLGGKTMGGNYSQVSKITGGKNSGRKKFRIPSVARAVFARALIYRPMFAFRSMYTELYRIFNDFDLELNKHD